MFNTLPNIVLGPRIRGLLALSGYTGTCSWTPQPQILSQADPTKVLKVTSLEPMELKTQWETWTNAQGIPVALTFGDSDGWTIEATPSPSVLDRNRTAFNKIVVITGGAQGFGEEITRGLFARGALVVIADMNLTGAQALAAELNSQVPALSLPGYAAGSFAGNRALGLEVNVTDEASMAAMIIEVVKTWGGIDVFVANAGVLKASSVLEQKLEDFDVVTRVNYTGYMISTKYAATVMKEQSLVNPTYFCDIIQINSKSGLEGSNKNGSYAGSKFGGIGLTQSFALELVAYNIKVNSICPGNFFDGPLWSHPEKGLFVQYLNTGKVPGAKTVEDVKAFYEAKVPMNRGCSGTDVLKGILYLMEQEYETGQALPITGGQVMLN
jgi:sorbitol-6-phosphate 2-dehydrogenase